MGELSRGNSVSNFFFSLFFLVREYPSYPKGPLVNLPSSTHTDSREHALPRSCIRHGGDKQPRHGDNASKRSIKQTKLNDESGGMLRNDAILPVQLLRLPFFGPSTQTLRRAYIYTYTPTSACPGKIIRAPTTPHTLHADGEKQG